MNRSISLFFASCMLVFLTHPLRAAETKKESLKDREAREAAAEDEAENKLSEGDRIALIQKYSGRYTPAEDNSDNPDVIGTLATPKGDTYQLKLEKPGLLRLLQDHAKEVVVLTGKLRNNGKYLVVSGLSLPEPAPMERKKRGGI